MNWPTEVTVAVIGLASAIMAVIAGGIVSLLTTHINRRDQEQQRVEERERWHAEFRLPRQLETLSAFYADAVTLHHTLLSLPFFTDPPNARRELYRPAYDAESKYSQSRALAFIYLNQAGRVISEQYGRAAYSVIWRRLHTNMQNVEDDFDGDLDDAYHSEGQLFKELIQVLEQELTASTNHTSTERVPR